MPAPQQLKQLQVALINAFPSKLFLERLLYYELGKNLNKITKDSDLQDIVFMLIQTAESQGWLVDLVRAAYQENSTNPLLKNLAEELLPEYLVFKTSDADLPKKSNFTIINNFTNDVSQQIPQSDFEPSTLWSFHHCSLLLENFLNERQREEWIGDLEEVLYGMHERQYPVWKLHTEAIRRTFDLLKSVFIVKVNSSFEKRGSIK